MYLAVIGFLRILIVIGIGVFCISVWLGLIYTFFTFMWIGVLIQDSEEMAELNIKDNWEED